MSSLLFSEAIAQTPSTTTAAAPTAAQSPFASFIPFVLVFVVFYFLVIRPQKKRLTEEQSFLEKLAKGDEIYTKAGLIGTIAGMTDKIVTLEISEGVKIKVLRSQIGGLAKKILETGTPTAAPTLSLK